MDYIFFIKRKVCYAIASCVSFCINPNEDLFDYDQFAYIRKKEKSFATVLYYLGEDPSVYIYNKTHLNVLFDGEKVKIL